MPLCDTYWYDSVGTGSPLVRTEPVRTWNGTVWDDGITYEQTTDTSDSSELAYGNNWDDETLNVLNVWNDELLNWDATSAVVWSEAPNAISNGTYWYDDVALTLSIRSAGAWSDITATAKIQETEPEPTVLVDGLLWYTPSTEILQQYSLGSPTGWSVIPVLVWEGDPTIVESADLWWDISGRPTALKTWNTIDNTWDIIVNFIQNPVDPAAAATIVVGSFWYNPTTTILGLWDGVVWNAVEFIDKPTDPTNTSLYVSGEAWYKPSTNTWYKWLAGWSEIFPVDSTVDPSVLPLDTYWFNTSNSSLQKYNGTVGSWTAVAFTTLPFVYTRGEQWYDTSSNSLNEWNGTTWVESLPVVVVNFNSSGGFTFATREVGSNTAVLIPTPEGSVAASTPCSIGTGYAYEGVADIAASSCEYANSGQVLRVYPARSIPENSFLWSNLTGALVITPNGGNDGISGVPSYLEVGVGTDGTPDERRELMDSIRRQLGYPIVEVELDNVQLDTCVNLGLEEYRKRAAGGYRRGFYFLDIQAGRQQYLMTNKIIGYNRIVTVMAAYRFTSAFLSSAHGAGAYGQIVLQHLYNMGTYDLTSFFLVSQYVEQLEHLFATRLTFSFHENDRLLSFYTAFTRAERVLIDCMVERSEQDLLKDRYSKTWIERYALSQAMMMLSHIRGKFASLPGAGGGISLNAAELVTLSESYREELILQLDEYVADQGVEDVGMQGSFILG